MTNPKTLAASMPAIPPLALSDAEVEANLKAQRRRDAMIAMRKARVPERHMTAKLCFSGHAADAWSRKSASVGRLIAERHDAMIALVGSRGTGKTQMAVQALWTFAEAGRIIAYSRAMDFFMDIKSTFRDGSSLDEASVIQHYENPHMLVLDEMQVRGGSEWENNLLTYLIDRRYAAKKATIMIANLKEDDFLASIGDSVADRLSETGAIVVCDWPSFRGSKVAS